MSQILVSPSTTWLSEPLAITDDTIYVNSVGNITNTIVQTVTAPVAVLGIMRIGLAANKNSIVNIVVYNNTTSAVISNSHYSIVIENTSPILKITVGAWITTGNSLTITTIDGNLIYINGEQIKFSSVNTTTNTLSGLFRGQNGTPAEYLISKYTEVWGLLLENKMNNVGYVNTWNSYDYNTVIGDPLQISNTTEALFLTNRKYIPLFPIISPIPPITTYSFTVSPTSWTWYIPLTGVTTTTSTTTSGPTTTSTSTSTSTTTAAPTSTTTSTSTSTTTAAPTSTTTSTSTSTSTTTAAPTSTTSTTTAAPNSAIFGFGGGGLAAPITNLVNNLGVVANDVVVFASSRAGLAAASYGGNKAIFGYGAVVVNGVSLTNLVSDIGVVGADVTGVGTPRYRLAAAGYGGDKAIFGYGGIDSFIPGIYTPVSITNLVDNTGVVATDTTGVGTARYGLAAAGYGGDKAIFGFGEDNLSSQVSITNLVNNLGVVANDVTGVGTARASISAASYGGDKAIFGYGYSGTFGGPLVIYALTNLVSNTGVVATDTAGVGIARTALAAAGYGGDKAIFGFGSDAGAVAVSTTNLVSNTGIVAADVTSVGTARNGLAAAKIGT
jgi:hypothetical protein